MRKNKYNIGDEVYHTDYLCIGIIKEIQYGSNLTYPVYLVDWKESPLKNVILFFNENLLEPIDFKYYIKKAGNKSVREIVKAYRDKVRKETSNKKKLIFSSVNGKIIEN